MDNKSKHPIGLKSGFTPLGMWAFSIGTSIGWGSFIVTCNTYLLKSGILGTIFGLLVGAAVVLVITRNLQYMIRTAPDAGGIYSFEKRVSGKDLGFLAFWFILLTYLAVLWANITSMPLFARFFLGDTFQFGFHYTIFGYEVWLGEALVAICAVVLIGLICARSSRFFRIGGDEFAVLSQGQDFENIQSLPEAMKAVNDRREKVDDVQIAFGMARFEGDKDVESMFERADRLMYQRKAALKS